MKNYLLSKNGKKQCITILFLIAIALIFVACVNPVLLVKNKTEQSKRPNIKNPSVKDTSKTGTPTGTQTSQEVCTGFDKTTYTIGTFEQGANAAARLHGLKCAFQAGLDLKTMQGIIDGKSGSNLLHSAADKGDLESVKYLVEIAKFDVDAENKDYYTALIFAANSGHMNVVQYLVETAHAQVNTKEQNAWTALMLSIYNNHLDITKYLINHGADVNAHKDGYTALILAAFNDHLDVVKYLVDNHADVDAENNNNNGTALIEAAGSDHLEIVKYLVGTAHASIDARDKEAWTALMRASINNHLEVVKYLVSAGADVTLKNINNENACSRAALAMRTAMHDCQ